MQIHFSSAANAFTRGKPSEARRMSQLGRRYQRLYEEYQAKAA